MFNLGFLNSNRFIWLTFKAFSRLPACTLPPPKCTTSKFKTKSNVFFSTSWFRISTRFSSTMVVEVDEAVGIYRELVKYPAVKLGMISSEEAPGHVQVYSEWTQRDLDRGETVKFARGHIIHLDVVIPTPPYELTNEQWNKESPSGKYRAVVRKVKDKKGEEKQYIEIWSDSQKIHNIDVQIADKHGKIYDDDGAFGSLEWSCKEDKILYIAEKKPEKTKSFFDLKPEPASTGESKGIVKGNEYVYKDNWGEQLSEKCRPVICILDIGTGGITLIESLPDDISPGQAIWCPEDSGIVCVGWKHSPYRLGFIYCPMRRSALYHIDLKNDKICIVGRTDQSVRRPVFSQCMTRLVYLENPASGPSAHASRLVLCDWPMRGVIPVIDVVRHAPDDEFPGIFAMSLNAKCWSRDSKRIVLNTNWRSKVELLVINVETAEKTRLTNDPDVGCWVLLTVHNDLILAACSSINQPDYLVIGTLPESGSEKNIKWKRLDETDPTKSIIKDISWSIESVTVPSDRINPKFDKINYDYLLVLPELKPTTPPPLIVYCHGGPHSAFTARYMTVFAGLARCGYALLMVNYRGSYGFGHDSIESLLGNIGTQDVLDIQSVAEQLCASGRVDKDRVSVVGGSHGGFLSAHLIGQFPDFYKAAVTRNAVINISSMVGISDIPDWAFVESGFQFEESWIPSSEIYAQMLKISPIVYVEKMKTPMLIMIGAKDLRVPPSQGHQLARALESRGKKVKTLVYPESCHPLSDVPSEADGFINIIRWIGEHL